MQARRFLAVLILALTVVTVFFHSTANASTYTAPNPTGYVSRQTDKPDNKTTQTMRLRLTDAITALQVEPEITGTYDRSLYPYWVHQGAGCDTRDSVLVTESRVNVDWIGDACAYEGEWRSYYDGTVTTDPRAFFVDHVVPLEEAHISGGFRWSPERREAYANDLGDPRTLVAVSAHADRTKADRDPSNWMPPLGQCRYVRDWVAVKIRWGLSVDQREHGRLRHLARSCADRWLRVEVYTGHGA